LRHIGDALPYCGLALLQVLRPPPAGLPRRL